MELPTLQPEPDKPLPNKKIIEHVDYFAQREENIIEIRIEEMLGNVLFYVLSSRKIMILTIVSILETRFLSDKLRFFVLGLVV